jgi:SET domain-containing protein
LQQGLPHRPVQSQFDAHGFGRGVVDEVSAGTASVRRSGLGKRGSTYNFSRMAKLRKHTSSTPFVRVAPSGVHGLGAFATRALPALALLGLYEGRRYSPQEVAAKAWDGQLTYLFTLSNQETIDGAKGGNGTRHLNHACDPNCEAVEEYDEAGRLLLKFQTLVPVAAGDELFIDYCLTADDGSPPSDYPCRCGSPNCRGTMLAPAESG